MYVLSAKILLNSVSKVLSAFVGDKVNMLISLYVYENNMSIC